MGSQKLVIACAVLLLSVGCATSNQSAIAKSKASQPEHQVEVSRSKTYQSMPEIRKDSTAVIRVTATATQKSAAADQAGQGPLQATLTTVRVDKVISGSVAPGGVRIRQLRTPGAQSEDLPPVLTTGQVYDLNIMPFEFVHGHPIAGTYVVTGDVGQFHVEGNGILHRALPAVGALPTTLSEAQLKQDAVR